MKIALFGFAGPNAVIGGGGSGAVFPSYVVSPLEGIQAAAGPDVEVAFDNGTNASTMVALAQEADIAIVFVGTISHEGADRESLSLDVGCDLSTSIDTGGGTVQGDQCKGNRFHQNSMIAAVAAANTRTVVVMSVPGAVVMPWADAVPVILSNFLPGQQVGHAIADVLFGRVNPSAKLPITMPNRENEQHFTSAQYPGLPYPGQPQNVFYSEGLVMGYRYYDEHQIGFTTGFPFGHGLSYTTFAYADLQTRGEVISFSVTNSGTRHGAEVAQLYLSFPTSAGEPPKQLKGFRKTAVLAPGQTERITLSLKERDRSTWDETLHQWMLTTGTFTINVGSSSRDLRLTATHSKWV